MASIEPVECIKVTITTQIRGPRFHEWSDEVETVDVEDVCTLKEALAYRDVHAAAVHWGTYYPVGCVDWDEVQRYQHEHDECLAEDCREARPVCGH